MKIQVLGTGCAKCKQLAANVQAAVAQAGITATVEKIEEMKEIARLGVLTTPALVVDGKVRSSGKVLGTAEITAIIVP